MPGVLEKRRRVSLADSDADERSEDFGSSANKRARSVRDASDDPSNDHSLTSGPDLHQPGSLVRVKLKNFVTYTSAEFNLGPSLNMIIGPNGTGKSTLICAICLGLGWSPQYLGRAKEIGEFVKHGSEEAVIEIELAASRNQRNPVIRRRIQKKDNKTTFYINDVSKSQKDVRSLAESFSIQINNLCQFLPQDRVVEFAKMDPIAMLGETLRAASSSQMVQWHDELKKLRADEKAVESKQQTELQHLKGLQANQNSTREDVERHKRREELIARSKALEQCRPFIHYESMKAEREQIREDIRVGKIELSRFQSEAEPIRRAEAEMDNDRARIERISGTRKRSLETKKGVVDRFAKKIDDDQQSLGKLAAKVEAEKQAERQRKQDVRRSEHEIVNLRQQLEGNAVEYDRASFSSRNAEIRARKSAAERKQAVLMNEMKGIRFDAQTATQTLREKREEKDRLNSRTGQRDAVLSQLSRDTLKGWNWLKANMNELSLKDRIYGPPVVECSVPDTRYADAVETVLRPGDLITITCTNAEDAKKVEDKLVGKKAAGGLELHHITIRTVPRARRDYPSPLTAEELTSSGFEGWISDYIEGPDAVLAMLCDVARIQSTAFSSRKITTEQYNDLERKGKLQRWIGGSEVYSINRRREYGMSSTSINSIRKAKCFTGQTVATDEMKVVEDAIRDIEQELSAKKDLHVARKEEYNAATAEVEAAENDLAKVQSDQEHLRKAYAAWEALPRRIDAKEKELEDIRRLSDDTNRRIKDIRFEHDQVAMAVARDTLSYAREIAQLRALQESFVVAELRLIEATSEVEGFKHDNREIIEAIKRNEENLETLENKKAHTIAELRKKKEVLKRLHANAAEDTKALMAEFKDLSIEQLDSEISAVDSRLALMADGNPQAITAFETLKRKIEETERSLADAAEKLEQFRARITTIREQWEPQLDTIVSSISDGFAHNFNQIGCAGQVSIKKDDDFAKWAIEIEVSFREGEPLAVLDSHRQSGGERAVSTIFYLMALQGLARSPFRVVDEINQGMDPRNERMVHERMVDIACQERTSQYFLVTPKLLNDLKFHPKMKVHCIASGEYMPDQRTNLDFQNLANLAMRVRKGAVAAA